MATCEEEDHAHYQRRKEISRRQNQSELCTVNAITIPILPHRKTNRVCNS